MATMKRYPQTMLATACIPWTDSFELDEKLFRDEVRHLLGAGIKHIYIMGTAGEGYDLTNEEYEKIVGVFMEEMSGPGLHPMVCVISQSTQLTLQRIEIAHKIGIREFQLVLPSWGVLNDKELLTYFHMICDRYPDCFFMIYNIGRSGRVLGIDHFQTLAKEIPNLVAAKFTTPNTVILNELLSSDCPIQFFVTDLGWAYGSQIGECGYLLSIGISNPKIARKYFEAGLNRDFNELFRIERELGLIRQSLIKVVGSNAMDGAYDKLTTKLGLPDFPLRLRPPYEYPSDEDYRRHLEYIQGKLPHWVQN